MVAVGEAGIGKTTLLRAVAEDAGGAVLEGGALATIRWLEYLPLVRALGRELTGSDREAVALEVQRAMADDTVLLLDDLQWAPQATLEVVALLAGRVPLLTGVRSGAVESDRVLGLLADAGFARVDLEPLDAGAAAEVARTVRPQLDEAELAALLRRAGGNPLLLRELAAHGEPSTSLTRTVSARLRRLPAPDLDAFALLSLAGRDLSAELVGGAAVGRLEAAGLVQRVPGDRVEVRHALLAEVAVADLDPERRQGLHGRLGELLTDPGEAARHFDLAGDADRCRDAALRAAAEAGRPGERASHLRLAAVRSTGEDADGLRLEAAEALEAAHDFDGVFDALTNLSRRDPVTTARAGLLRIRAAWSAARLDDLVPAIEEALAAATAAGGDVEVLVRIEACRKPIFLDNDLEEGLRQARAAMALAEERGIGIARAKYFLGTALAILDLPGGIEELEQANRAARADGDVSTELLAANNLISFHESAGSPDFAVGLAREHAERARALGLGHWDANFRAQALQLDFHAGRLAGLVAALEELHRRPLDARTRDSVLEVLCMALVDTGRADEAVRRAEDALRTASDDASRTHFWWALAEAELWSGAPRRALAHIERFLAEMPTANPNRTFGLVTRAWALFDLGEDPATAVAPQVRPLLFGLPHEVAGLEHAHAGRVQPALAELATAAELWAPYHLRGELRCEWAAGELLRRHGELDDAVRILTQVEKRSAEAGLVSVLNRAQRSLRAAGERRAAGRSSGVAGLTGREQEVLQLVAEGLTNDQIAHRLGIARRTVVTQIQSASAKLGADNRLQAGALLSRLAGNDR